MSEEAINHADIVVKGEGEQALLHIINNKIKSGIIELPAIKNTSEYVDMYGVSFMTSYPGTKLWQDLKQKGVLPEKPDWSKFAQDDLRMTFCETILPNELEKLYIETLGIQSLKLERIWSKTMLHPFKAFSYAIKHPLISIKLLFKAIN